ncbi:MAG: hypothetical protein COZ06_17915 [Armatimonadetes bacterium CG_4_10_14_3_um_filter_66_18]|nr:hypothetical protein [Armatimonadota bacterium]OIP11113.1 MAG: hypothetical protein AUJ96_02930 [Armatimonadetes bacterium CG2_30_66_41]PIU88559.1 MAG: hypothetical protein COS65_30280 [Armatimonadetes bacterium CG06_land_8_20_14_3_00_66_21]PIW13022.1 MAG: hypothetical protein COW34_11900 [Armatimonadetes bacterium CG17_big_fil_post_rev_8_21_14_2_50_66_6]PIX37876.1 MAG: hypothetical protein COZ57_32060 [Armatimonadetes bacterium CG_4_8_14_3_um_filter_66_20]PIY47179.1 MAG: hypothetical prote
MKKRVRSITAANFTPFGQYLSFPPPKSTKPTIAVPKVIDYWKQQAVFDSSMKIEIGALTVYDREHAFCEIERHRRTPELLVILDAEVAIPCAPPHKPMRKGDVPASTDIEVFKVPAGSAVLFPVGGWHWAPYPTTTKKVNILVVFRDNTSQDDLEIVELAEEVTF